MSLCAAAQPLDERRFEWVVGLTCGPLVLAGLAAVPLPAVIMAAKRMKRWHCGIITVRVWTRMPSDCA